jgi:Family of unknown function (DUF6152)
MTTKVKVLWFAVLVVGLLATGSSLFAHHGDAAYSPKALELKDAVVTEYKWMNPHSLIKIRHTDEKGESKEWTMEMGSTPSMTQLGFTKSTMKPGDVITVQLYPAKNSTLVGRMHRITFSDGSQLFDNDSTEPPAKRADYTK